MSKVVATLTDEVAPETQATATQAADAEGSTARRILGSTALRILAGVVLLAIWQFGVTLFAPAYVATPLNTVKRIPAVFADPAFGGDVQTTLLAIIEGLAIAVVIGTLVGLVMGRLPDVNRVLGMYVGTFYAMPLIAVVPLLTVWFGYTPEARLAMVVLEAVLPIIYNVAEGARLVPTNFLDVTKIHHAPWWRVWGGVVLPNALPYVLAGLDLAIGRALIGAVVAEFVTAIPGLGYYILFNVRSFHENEAMVALLVLVAFALVLRALINLAISRGFRWYRPA
ncbi:MAG TPA: ABC transporter permease subunit [Pseudonocardiaceae bacterium]|nr:ABC transporter permease subunit [Pseudonocardiaceae bacterium]